MCPFNTGYDLYPADLYSPNCTCTIQVMCNYPPQCPNNIINLIHVYGVIIRDSNTSKRSGTVQNTVLFGSVGGALAVVIGGIVLIVVVTVAVLVTKRRKSQYQDATGKGT